jgi:hypothetical protein
VFALHREWFECVAQPYLQGGDALLAARPYVAGQSLLASAYRALASTPVTASDPDARAAIAHWDPHTVHTLYPDIVDMVLDGFKIQTLADMPKQQFLWAIKRVRQIKETKDRSGNTPTNINESATP